VIVGHVTEEDKAMGTDEGNNTRGDFECQIEVLLDSSPDHVSGMCPEYVALHHPLVMGKRNPKYMVKHKPHIMAEHFPEYMVKHHLDMMEEYWPNFLAEYNAK